MMNISPGFASLGTPSVIGSHVTTQAFSQLLQKLDIKCEERNAWRWLEDGDGDETAQYG